VYFEDYQSGCFDQCMGLFDKNCPTFFAENEREDYAGYLQNLAGSYKVIFDEGKLIAAFGLGVDKDSNRARVTWIMVCPDSKGQGVGAKMMAFAKQYAIDHQLKWLDIAASHLSAPFFEKFGAVPLNYIENGWGPDMHRVDMALSLG
jgi:GNAT superfamily N-acetyltransferase